MNLEENIFMPDLVERDEEDQMEAEHSLGPSPTKSGLPQLEPEGEMDFIDLNALEETAGKASGNEDKFEFEE